MKPVSVNGIFDHKREIQVKKEMNGEKGFMVITPLYTHLSETGESCAILVNRGWIPYDLRMQRMHLKQSAGTVTGLLYTGDKKNKWAIPNSPTIESYRNVYPEDFAIVDQLGNVEEASQFMLQQIDLDSDTRQILPTVPCTSDLLKFQSTAERHDAYSTMWKALTFTGILANTFLWLGL